MSGHRPAPSAREGEHRLDHRKRRIALGLKTKKEEHKKNRKLRDAAAGGAASSKLRRDPGVPDLGAFKERLSRKMEAMDDKDKARAQRARERREAALAKRRAAQGDGEDDDGKSAEQLKDARPVDVAKRRWFFKEMNKVIEASDVVLEVLDARDPLGCRCPDIERMIISKRQAHGNNAKQIVLILNKIDLVPPEVVGRWVKHFRREYPTLAFKSSTSQARGSSRLAQSALPTDLAKADTLSQTPAVGAQALLQLLKNYARQAGVKKKKQITVGIIGYPNVGKSSLINSLKREKSVGVSATPGFTRSLQTVHLDSDINLVDSPGVMFSAGAPDEDLVLRNCLKVESLVDPTAAAYAVCRRVTPEQLQTLYKVGSFSTPDEFLALLAVARGFLGKGGVPKLESAARLLLIDWNEGKIPFYSLPPEEKTMEAAEVVSAFSAEIDIDALFRETMQQLKSAKLEGPSESEASRTESSAPMTIGMEAGGDDDGAALEDDEGESKGEHKRRDSVVASASGMNFPRRASVSAAAGGGAGGGAPAAAAGGKGGRAGAGAGGRGAGSRPPSRPVSRRGSLAGDMMAAAAAAASASAGGMADDGMDEMLPGEAGLMLPPKPRKPTIDPESQRNQTMRKEQQKLKKAGKKEMKRRSSQAQLPDSAMAAVLATAAHEAATAASDVAAAAAGAAAPFSFGGSLLSSSSSSSTSQSVGAPTPFAFGAPTPFAFGAPATGSSPFGL